MYCSSNSLAGDGWLCAGISRRSRPVVPVLEVLAACVMSCATQGQLQSDTPIFDAIQSQESRVTNARIIYNLDRTLMPESIYLPGYGALPEEKVINQYTGVTFQLSGSRALYRHFLVDYFGKGVTEPSAHAFDGDEVVSFDPASVNGLTTGFDYGQARIHNSDKFQQYGNISLWPILFALRPTASNGLALAQVSVDETTIPAGELSKFGIPTASSGSLLEWERQGYHRRAYIERGDGWVRPVRFEEHSVNDGPDATMRLLYEIDILAVKQDEATMVPVPIEWRTRKHGKDGMLNMESHIKLTEFHLNDASVLEDFSLRPFPEGTRVIDERSGLMGWQRDGKIVSDDRERRSGYNWSRINITILIITGIILVTLAVGWRARR